MSQPIAGGAPLVLYVHPAKQGVAFPYHRQEPELPFHLLPAGVVALMNLLRAEGWAARGVNAPGERLIAPSFDLETWLRAQGEPRLMLVDLHWYEHCYGALDVARVCKRIWPASPLVLGGLTASGFSHEILDGFPWVDAIVRGDAEEPLRRLAGRLRLRPWAQMQDELRDIPNLSYRAGDEIVHNAQSYCANPQELDALDFVAVDWLEHPRHNRGFQYASRLAPYSAAEGAPLLGHWLTNGRGCAYGCSYCGGSQACHQALAGRVGPVMRSPEAVVRDLQRLATEGVHQAALTLDPCLAGEAHWRALFAGMRQAAVRIGLYIESFQLPPPGWAAALAAAADLAHTDVAISVLSQERLRALHGKPFTDAELWMALDELRAQRIPIVIYFSLNLPGETERTFQASLRLAERIARRYPAELLRMMGQPHTIDPYSAIARHPDEYGVDLQVRTFDDFYDHCRRTAAADPSLTVDGRHGFTDRRRAPGESDRIQRLWQDFARAQTFECY